MAMEMLADRCGGDGFKVDCRVLLLLLHSNGTQKECHGVHTHNTSSF